MSKNITQIGACTSVRFSWIYSILTNPYRYIIALYGLCNVFLIDFDKKVLETFKGRDGYFVETLENLYFKSYLIYKKFSQKMR